MKRLARFSAAAILIATAIVISGCATPANQKAMATSTPLKVARQHPQSVNVTTSGGSDDAARGSNIGNAEFKAAIESSITDSKLFKEVAQGKDAPYQLSVQIIQLDRPMFGASFTVTLEAGWSLVRSRDKQVVYRKSIKSSHTATTSDAFVGAKRLQLAVEGAARANIEQGLTAIGELALEGPAKR